jgi:hypothetical protein
MRKPNWRDSWVITVLCTVETLFYLAPWASSFQQWLAMGATFLVALVLFGIHKRLGEGFWIMVLACVTAFLIPATPCAYLIVGLAEVSSPTDQHYRYLSLIPLGIVVVIWVLVYWNWHREDSQKGPPQNSKRATGG